jgi:hypothetical protein
MANKVSAESVDYMELQGAQKDADCDHVAVKGGVSSQLGCCNDFSPERGAQDFCCGTCGHLVETSQPDQQQPQPQSTFYGE